MNGSQPTPGGWRAIARHRDGTVLNQATYTVRTDGPRAEAMAEAAADRYRRHYENQPVGRSMTVTVQPVY